MKRLPTWLEIDLDRLDRNLERIQGAVGAGVGIMLTVKADAYGHGAVQVAGAAAPRVKLFGVATVDEAIELKESGVKSGIVILSPILETEVPAVARHGFAITLSSASFVHAVARQSPDQALAVHVEKGCKVASRCTLSSNFF
jgi:alanine racemase